MGELAATRRLVMYVIITFLAAKAESVRLPFVDEVEI
jgi:hypothetical protein